MCRVPLVLLFAVCLAGQGLCASSLAKRDLLNLLGISAGDSGDSSPIASGLDDIGSIILTLKGQVKEIFEDIFLQCLQHFLEILRNLKLKFLKKIGQYTISHVFHAIFDGVTEFVEEENNAKTTTEEPSYVYKYPYATSQILKQY